MEEVYEKVKNLKLRALEILEGKMNGKMTYCDINILTQCLNNIAEDKNLYSSTLIKMLNNNKGFAGISNNETKSE